MTVWRDLTTLEEEVACVACVAARAIAPSAMRVPSRSLTASACSTRRPRRIARYAAETFVTDGEILFMEAGTTVAAMVKYLAGHQHLTVIGNGWAP